MSNNSEKWRWKIANLLDRSKRVCWSDLVDWAAFGLSSLRREIEDGAGKCRAEARKCGECYCGKFRLPEMDAHRVGRGFRPDGKRVKS